MNVSIKELFQTHSIRFSEKKASIYHHLLKAQHPLDAQTLYHNLADSFPIDLTTVYRTLNQFKEKGLLDAFMSDDGTCFYEIHTGHSIHPHLYCEKCHQMICLEPLPDALVATILQHTTPHCSNVFALHFNGICTTCQQG